MFKGSDGFTGVERLEVKETAVSCLFCVIALLHIRELHGDRDSGKSALTAVKPQ